MVPYKVIGISLSPDCDADGDCPARGVLAADTAGHTHPPHVLHLHLPLPGMHDVIITVLYSESMEVMR